MTNNIPIAITSAHPNTQIVVPIPSAHLWSPEDPFLYDLKITLYDRSENITDCVTSYFGLRKIALGQDTNGFSRILLNNKFVFEAGVLDQGYWPDGIYTPPTDQAMRNDIETAKQLGFNLIRKHVKVEPDRWYYWCDKLGMLVWQDMPSANPISIQDRYQFEAELNSIILHLDNHPSIIMWVLFNEGWGEYDADRLAQWVHKLDPSRLVDHASGWIDVQAGDIKDMHHYPEPVRVNPETSRAAVLGEFGGLGLEFQGHKWSETSWSYQTVGSTSELRNRFAEMWRHVRQFKENSGLSAAVYTQLTDIETECNGLMTYDRKMIKLAPEETKALISGQTNPVNPQP